MSRNATLEGATDEPDVTELVELVAQELAAEYIAAMSRQKSKTQSKPKQKDKEEP